MKNKIQKLKKSADYIVLAEIFTKKNIFYGILFNVFTLGSMYGALELWLIIKFG
ncbi:hypothetical protein [uncultured Mediterranean phage uvMED]|nr:hypothetical protein [uncultured Mediterranean phage uvMED]